MVIPALTCAFVCICPWRQGCCSHFTPRHPKTPEPVGRTRGGAVHARMAEIGLHLADAILHKRGIRGSLPWGNGDRRRATRVDTRGGKADVLHRAQDLGRLHHAQVFLHEGGQEPEQGGVQSARVRVGGQDAFLVAALELGEGNDWAVLRNTLRREGGFDGALRQWPAPISKPRAAHVAVRAQDRERETMLHPIHTKQ